MKKVKTLAVLNFLFFLIAFAMSQLSQLKLFNNNDMGQVSDKYANVFTPAGLTFAVWGVIYIALFAFTIFHLIQAWKKSVHTEANQVVQKIGTLFIWNNIATALWVLAFMYEFLGISMFLMIVQLYSLARIHWILKIFQPQKTASSKWFTQVPLTLYFAWISVATVANAAAFLVSVGWDGGPLTGADWTVVLIIIICFISSFMIWRRKNPYYGLIVMWAFYGIQLKRKQVDALAYADVIQVVWFAFGFVALLVLFRFFKNNGKPKEVPTQEIHA